MRKALLVNSADYGICTGPANSWRSVRPAAWGMQRRRCASRCRGLRRAVSGCGKPMPLPRTAAALVPSVLWQGWFAYVVAARHL